ncbi:MAG TPA: hypothetical protein H9671_06345 [Firmicutes bacterium]|nr:hypothetical protein [Bacillota bacterium]
MLYVTGDMHGDVSAFRRPGISRLRKNDCLFVCGDFGFIWQGTPAEKRLLKWIGKRPYSVLFAEGCHENFDLLAQYETEEWNGGKVRRISGNLLQLMRGEIYTIENKRVFVFGGGESDEQDIRVEAGTYWPVAAPSTADAFNAQQHLTACGQKVDYIITHEAPEKVRGFLSESSGQEEYTPFMLNQLTAGCEFSMWYFGKYHMDRLIPPCYTAVFRKVLPMR